LVLGKCFLIVFASTNLQLSKVHQSPFSFLLFKTMLGPTIDLTKNIAEDLYWISQCLSLSKSPLTLFSAEMELSEFDSAISHIEDALRRHEEMHVILGLDYAEVLSNYDRILLGKWYTFFLL